MATSIQVEMTITGCRAEKRPTRSSELGFLLIYAPHVKDKVSGRSQYTVKVAGLPLGIYAKKNWSYLAQGSMFDDEGESRYQ